jgi:hypothetical protein
VTRGGKKETTMYTMITHRDLARHLSREVPACAVAVVIAEVFYKFHSFSLECLAFLPTWFVLSWLAHRALPVSD